MKTHRQSGFAVVEAILILVIVGIIGGTGYFVWHAKQNTDETLNNTANSQPAVAKKTATTKETPKQTDETASWLLYESPGKEYTIRLADGWKLDRYLDSPKLYAFNPADTLSKPGTKAVVSQVEFGKGGSAIGLSMGYEVSSAVEKPSGTPQPPLQTQDGLEVKIFSYTQTEPQAEGIGAAPQGATIYNYQILAAGNKVFSANYGFEQGSADNHLTVEKSLKTLHFN